MAESREGPDATLSEHDLIARYFAPLASGFPGAYGLKDDAAVIQPPPGTDLVVTTDALVAGVHFFADDAPGDIAWKALAVNISDLAAKGAAPLAYSLALAMPRPPSSEFLAGFASGLGEAQEHFGIALSGGDTTNSGGAGLMIAVTAFGMVPQGQAVRRGGAHAGDSLYVSGTIGDAALGLKLRRGDADTVGWPISKAEREYLIRRYLRPEPRIALASLLLAHASASMDVSDGLAIDCGRLCAASSVGAAIDLAAIPLSASTASVLSVQAGLIETLVTGGDDYEILFAVKAGDEAALQRAAASAGVQVTRIGRITAGAPVATMLRPDGTPLELATRGFDHFSPAPLNE